ncbi:flagellar assembly protein H [Citrobacter koseri]|nr:flagellar assembly protein H [Citrobacter koseri]
MSNELPWQIWTPDESRPPLAEFVPMEHRRRTIAIDDEPELSAEQQLEQQLAQLKMQAHEQGYNAGLTEGRQKGHEQGYQEGLAQGLEQGQTQAPRSTGAAECPNATTGQRVSEYAGRAGQRDCLAPDANGAGSRSPGDRPDASGGQLRAH